MVLTRAETADPADPTKNKDATNTDTPWVDQSQTYTSHASHQVFLREYAMNAANQPVSTGKLLGGLPAGQTYPNSPDGQDGIGTWAAVKLQATTKLGLLLTDKDVLNVPMLAVDPYGNFIPGPHGLPQYVTASGLVEGNLATPVAVPGDAKYFDTPFLTDIAHNADPSPQDTNNNPAIPPAPPDRRTPTTPRRPTSPHQPAGTYDDEMLNAHFICGDGRCNENIALSSIHQIFHSEHDRLVDYIKGVLTSDTSTTGVAALTEWQLPTTDSPDGWNGSRLFQAARFVTEMEYQHLVFEEFARKVQPLVHVFHVYSPDVNPAIDNEFAAAVYRFGHSMLDDTVARTNVDPTTGAKSDNSVPLLTAFLNPPEYFNGGRPRGTLTPRAGRGQRRHGFGGPDRQRDRRVRHRDPAQQPARPSARPADPEHGQGPGIRNPAAERTSPADLRPDQRRPDGPVHGLERLRSAPQAPRVADQLRGGLRHPPDHPGQRTRRHPGQR